MELAKKKVTILPTDDLTAISRRFLSNIQAAEGEKILNEYLWILKGFFELLQGGTPRAAELFKMVLDRVTKSQAVKKKFLFVALIGVVCPIYSSVFL